MHDYKNIYAGIAPVEKIVSGALAYARARVGAAGVVTLDVLQEGSLAVIKSLAVEKLKDGVEMLLADATASYQMFSGERPAGEGPEAHDWRDGFDMHLLDALGSDMQKAIGPSAIGEHFTDADVDDLDVRGKVAHELAERLAESAQVYDRRDPNNVKVDIAKTLNLAGVSGAELVVHAATATGRAIADAAPSIDEPTARARVEQVVGAYAIRQGDAFDPIVASELLSAAFDEDHFIAVGAIERMGGVVADQAYFAAYQAAAPLEAAGNTLAAAMAALVSGAVVEAPKKTGKKIKVDPEAGLVAPSPQAVAVPTSQPVVAPPLAPPSPSKPSTQTTAGASTLATSTADGDYADVVRIWRKVGKDTDQSIGEAVGVSRPQVGNIAAGKAKLALDPAQKEALKRLLQQKGDDLRRAASLLE